jgi:prepilin-type N-terminal cleavage/methylation domain-containing protein
MNKGFTIIELITVVAIIAIITAITTTNFTTSKAKARDTKRVSDISQLQFALELFFDRCNQYPTVASNMPNLAAGNGSNGCPVGVTLGPTFISNLPNPPTAGDYYYAVDNSSTPTDYVLRTRLETTNPVLNDDIDATTYTVDCADTSPNFYYCVVPK